LKNPKEKVKSEKRGVKRV